MGCNQTKAEAPQAQLPAEDVEGTTLLGRIGDRSPARSNGAAENKELQVPTKSAKLQLPLRKEQDVVRQEIESLCRAVAEQLPGGPRICLLGGATSREPHTKAVVEAIAARLAPILPSNAVVLTGGLPGIQETMATTLALHGFTRVVNLVHLGHISGYAGEDLVAGMDAAERRQVLGRVGDVYICIEGGPGVAEEAQIAHARGAVVLPLPCSGGASAGAFGFPQKALERPRFASPEDWAALKDPQRAAEATVDILRGALKEMRQRGGGLADSSPDVMATGPCMGTCAL